MKKWLSGGSVLLCALAVACQGKVGASAGASTGGDVHAEGSGEVKTDGDAKPEAKPDAKPEAAPTTTAEAPPPPPDGTCAFRCYVAEGPTKVQLSPEEERRFRDAFATTMDQFRQCSAAHYGKWRRKSSPVLNLRFNFQGELADEGHDLTGYGNDSQHNCYATVPHTMPKVAGPPASTVRCSETCETPKTKTDKTPKGAKPPKAAPPAAPAPAPAAKP
ncbi:MAG: hypothetical protein JNL38_40045 [Myxococcales bacterium]|nr:hypothetical protein [Myxococcales bacterium]